MHVKACRSEHAAKSLWCFEHFASASDVGNNLSKADMQEQVLASPSIATDLIPKDHALTPGSANRMEEDLAIATNTRRRGAEFWRQTDPPPSQPA
jgi:hypothetical protein